MGPPASATDPVDYLRDIKPLLAEKCAACHGVLKQEAGLRLDHGESIRTGGDSGPVLDIDLPPQSTLLERITTDDIDRRMPPEGEGEALSEEQISLLTDWVQAGAKSPDNEALPTSPEEHWSWQPLDRNRLATLLTLHRSPQLHPIDLLISQADGAGSVAPLPLADPRVQLRRLSFDLSGLPPTVEQQQEFASNPTHDNWGQIVDQLLSSPTFGQRWARHWMDVWRYSDWDGYKNELRGSQRHIWRWRDWIEESLCEDIGYDQMILQMLAGDEIAPDQPDVLRATGFLARNFHKSNRDIWLDATVEHTAKAFLATTINCARCHDHKYDPITQKDYYAMRAVFEPHHVRTERLPGQRNLEKDGLVRAFDKMPDEKTFLYIAGNEKRPDKDNPIAPQAPLFFERPFEIARVDLPRVAFAPNTRAFVQQEDLKASLATVEKSHVAAKNSPSKLTESSLTLAKANHNSLVARWEADLAKLDAQNTASVPTLIANAAQAERAATLTRAEHDVIKAQAAAEKAESELEDGVQAIDAKLTKALTDAKAHLKKLKGETVEAPTKYTAAITEYPRSSTGRRLALAQWIASRENPLTARVAVNHIWARHFGEPLVENVFDFGLRSARPKHWRVLDYLALELVDNDWSLKHIHHQIVTSDAYRRASHTNGPQIAKNNRLDPDNELLWRANVRRLDAEAVRDQLIYLAGNLDLKRGGPDIDFTEGETIYRRSLYFRHAYEKQMTMLVLFDGAAPTECYQRSESIVPQQALALANSPLSYDQSRAAAKLIWSQAADDAHAIKLAFERILGRHCSAAELNTCLAFLKEQAELFRTPDDLETLSGKSQGSTTPAVDPNERARENLVHTLVNHNDFVTLR